MLRIVSQNKKLNNRGVTLVEVMIALVIMLVVFMGLIQASLLSIDSNLRNEIRDEAARIGAEYMTRSRTVPFTALVAGTNTVVVTRNFRSLSQNFNVTTTVSAPLDPDNIQITVQVGYTYRDEPVTFRMNSIVRRPK